MVPFVSYLTLKSRSRIVLFKNRDMSFSTTIDDVSVWRRRLLFLVMYALSSVNLVHSFTVSRWAARNSAMTTTISMCICINCARVTNCKAYHFVETKHEQPHINLSPSFEPREGSPTIHVNVRPTKQTGDEIARIWKEHALETAKAEQNNESQNSNNILRGETVYDLSGATTIEYDVVQCADFVHDPGCWVRNMPEEIKRANPNFVPTWVENNWVDSSFGFAVPRCVCKSIHVGNGDLRPL